MRAAADELRAELAGETVTFVVNRNINVSNVCIVGCAFCGFGQGKRSPDAYEHDRGGVPPRASARPSTTARPRSACSPGIHPDWGLEDYERWLRVAKDEAARAPTSTCTPTRRWRSPTCATSRACRPREVFARLRDAGLGSTPGTAAEVLHDGVRERISPEQAAGRALGRDHRGLHRAGLRSTSTVMFGHIEEPWELAEHMRVVRELQERTGGITEFVPLSFIPFHTLLGRTHGVEEISREENLKHTAVFRLALGPHDPQPAGVVGEDGPRRGDRGAALGRQRPRRDADGGVHQPPGRQLPRRPPRPARADRGRARGRAPGGRAHDALRHPPALSRCRRTVAA